MASSIWAGYPRSHTPGRARPVQFVTLHYTAGSEGPNSAENGIAYDKIRTDGTSCHYFSDSLGPALQEVPDGDRSHSALFHGNEIGIHIEICGTVQTREQWLDPVSLATLKTTAALVRDLCDRHGLEKRHLSVAETRAAYYGKGKPTGINDHRACTLAFPEDGGDHTDVGVDFPWDVFMALVVGETTEDDMQQYFFARDGASDNDPKAKFYLCDGMLARGPLIRPVSTGQTPNDPKNPNADEIADIKHMANEMKMFKLWLGPNGDIWPNLPPAAGVRIPWTGGVGGPVTGPVDLTDEAVDEVAIATANELGRRIGTDS